MLMLLQTNGILFYEIIMWTLDRLGNILKKRSYNKLLNAEKIPFWQDNALFASKAKINVF